jgi:hypothetical protein
MDKVRKPFNSECYASSSESFMLYLVIKYKYFLNLFDASYITSQFFQISILFHYIIIWLYYIIFYCWYLNLNRQF